MNIAVISKNDDKKKALEQILESCGLKISETPELIFVWGGDGTILYSERVYPGIPKVPLRGSKTSKTRFYDEKNIEKIISLVKEKRYSVSEYGKIEYDFNEKSQIALNEIQVHNLHPYEAIRFSLYVDEKLEHENIIGDGILVSTPFGSSGYYYSLGGNAFTRGLGIAFNNPHARISPTVVPAESTITVRILRGAAELVSDNNPEMFSMREGDTVTIRKSSGKARFVVFEDI